MRESSKAYAAAKIYFELGSERTLKKVAAKIGKSEDLMKRWSARYHWADRAVAFNAWQAQIEQRAREKKAMERAELWADREEQSREADYQLSVKMRKKASSMLDFPLASVTKTVDGTTTTVHPGDWDMATPARLAETASKLAAGTKRSESAQDHRGGEVDEWYDTELTARRRNESGGSGE
jgi:hypothetical protein